MWANRGRGQMAVWLARTDVGGAADAVPDDRDGQHDHHIAVTQERPQHHRRRGAANSADSSAYFDWWPRRGCKPGAQPAAPAGEGQQQPCSQSEWVEMAFAKPANVSSTEVYWFDDTGRGGVRVPQSWKLLYKDGDTWKPVEGATFGVARDAWNTVTFKPVTTSALRIELTMQPDVSAGLQEWKVK